jgi:hypothetical protein
MAFISSQTILAKDVIAEAQELAGIEEARLSLSSVGRIFYNMAISDIHTLLLYIDVESLLLKGTLEAGDDLAGTSFSFVGKFLEIDLTSSPGLEMSNFDKILSLEIVNGNGTTKTALESFQIPLREFIRHKSKYASGVPSGAVSPYEEAVIYTVSGEKLLMLWGNSITITLTNISTGVQTLGSIYYTRQPVLLTSVNFNTAKIDIPDKYYSLLVNRIAAYAELRSGITDKAVVLSQNSMNQIIAPLEPQLRAKIMDSFQLKPIFTPNEDGGKLNYGK